MNVAVSHHPGREDVILPTNVRRVCEIVSVKVFDDLAAAEPFWRRLEASHALATPYQRFDFLAAWQQHVGARNGVTPFIVIGFGPDGEPAFLWPFGRTRIGPLNVVQFLGSKHANFNVGLWRRDLAATHHGAATSAAFSTASSVAATALDLLALFSQPFGWDGHRQPVCAAAAPEFRRLTACASPSTGPAKR